MSYSRLGPKTEGGQGGKRGHSNMSHYDYTEVIKDFMKSVRRRQGSALIEEQLDDLAEPELEPEPPGGWRWSTERAGVHFLVDVERGDDELPDGVSFTP